jgi:hypothetical protein
MPTVLRVGGLRVVIYPNDHPPAHVHVLGPAQHIGRVIVNSALDRPWSQYFCCMLAGNRVFVRNYPVATKAVLRAILKAADLCVTEPARAAQLVVEGGYTRRYDYVPQTLNEIPYDKWRPRTRCGSTPCACTKSAWSNRARRRSSPTAQIGAS